MRSIVLLLSISAQAATYYIDYGAANDSANGTSTSTPWKRAPGMVGFAGSYSHSAGDVFIFKGGVTWPTSTLPLTIGYSGTSGNVDTYTTNHAWYSGGAWSQPTFDGGGTASTGVAASSKSYFTLNDIRIVAIGTAQTSNGLKAVDITNCDHFTVSNNTIASETWLGIYAHLDSAGTRASVDISGNDLSHVGQAIVVATGSANAIWSGVLIHDNVMHDFSSQIGGGVHGDGIHTWGQVGDTTQYIENMSIYNNRFYGDFSRSFGTEGGMTAFIYVSGGELPTKIFNNVGTYTGNGASQFEAMISMRGIVGINGGHGVYNNTFLGTDPGMSAALLMGDGASTAVPNCTIKNNLFAGMHFGLYVTSGSQTGLVSDNNLIYTTNDTAYYVDAFKSWAAWQALGFDTHGSNANPLLTGSLGLSATSPAIGAGANLTSLSITALNSDKSGNARPASGAWDIGAYQYQSGGPTAGISGRVTVSGKVTIK